MPTSTRTLPSLFAAARAQAPLTPPERAILKFLLSTGLYSAVAALLIVGQIILAHGTPSLGEGALVAAIVMLGASVNGAAKYCSAGRDPQVGAALTLLADESVQAACAAAGVNPALAAEIAAAVRGALTPAPQAAGASTAPPPIDRFGP